MEGKEAPGLMAVEKRMDVLMIIDGILKGLKGGIAMSPEMIVEDVVPDDMMELLQLLGGLSSGLKPVDDDVQLMFWRTRLKKDNDVCRIYGRGQGGEGGKWIG